VDRDAARLLRRQAFDLARMDAGAYVDTQLAHAGADFECTVDSAGGAVEQRHEAVTGGVDLLAPEAFELTAHLGVMAVEQLAPGTISEFARTFRRADEVGEDDGCEYAVFDGRRTDPGQELLDLVGHLGS
jgi:hypothetical protein